MKSNFWKLFLSALCCWLTLSLPSFSQDQKAQEDWLTLSLELKQQDLKEEKNLYNLALCYAKLNDLPRAKLLNQEGIFLYPWSKSLLEQRDELISTPPPTLSYRSLAQLSYSFSPQLLNVAILGLSLGLLFLYWRKLLHPKILTLLLFSLILAWIWAGYVTLYRPELGVGLARGSLYEQAHEKSPKNGSIIKGELLFLLQEGPEWSLLENFQGQRGWSKNFRFTTIPKIAQEND